MTYTKIIFRLDPNDWHGTATEGIFGSSDESFPNGNYFRIENSPFFVRGVSYLDTVRTDRVPEFGDIPVFAEVAWRSGHSTYMILAEPDSAKFQEWWNKLEELGCSYESGKLDTRFGFRALYSVDVPADADIDKVLAVLVQGEDQGVWIFQEGHCEHP